MPTFQIIMPDPSWVVFAKWTIQFLSGTFLLLTFLVTYRHNVRVRASDLLLKLEEHFIELGSKLAFLEYNHSCYDPVKGIMTRYLQDPDLLSEVERATLRDIDECIRFLYICTLQSGPKITRRRKWWHSLWHSSHLPHAYHWFLNRLNDQETRPELFKYVRAYYPTLSKWLERNERELSRRSV